MGRATAGVSGIFVGMLRIGELEKLAKVGRIDFSELNWYRKESSRICPEKKNRDEPRMD
jgi:hypothetical protein